MKAHFVIHLDDHGKLHVSDTTFFEEGSAEKYAGGIAPNRKPVVVSGQIRPVCDSPHCWNFRGMTCGTTIEGREALGAECTNSSYYTGVK
jgi:hypothetical protein